MRKPGSISAVDPAALTACLTEASQLTNELHDVAVEACSHQRVHARAHLRNRSNKLTRSLLALFEALKAAAAAAPTPE